MAKKRFSVRVGEEFPGEVTFGIDSGLGHLPEERVTRLRLQFFLVTSLVIVLVIALLTGLYQWVVTNQFAEFKNIWDLTWTPISFLFALCFLRKVRSNERRH